MDQVQLSTQEAVLYGMLLTGGIGFAIGLVPLILGIVKKKIRLGVFGLLASTIGGALLGLLLSVPAVVIFVWLILARQDSSATDIR